jgi:hypothetical protein
LDLLERPGSRCARDRIPAGSTENDRAANGDHRAHERVDDIDEANAAPREPPIWSGVELVDGLSDQGGDMRDREDVR